jgi:hypothetical protein
VEVKQLGGRGASAFSDRAKQGDRGLAFSGGKGKPSDKMFPSWMNGAKNTGSIDRVIKNFNEKHTQSAREWGVQVDDNGYVTHYYKGSRGSVSYDASESEGKHFIHNHPAHGWGNFSGTDLETWAGSGQKAVTASSRNELPPKGINPKLYSKRRAGTYTIKKKSHFKAAEFSKAIHSVKVSSDNYDADLSKWLSRNAKKYGYEYSYKPAKNKV